MENSIIELQIIIAHQREDIENLSKELYRQQTEIAELRRQLAAFAQRFQKLEDESYAVKDVSEEIPPPHY